VVIVIKIWKRLRHKVKRPFKKKNTDLEKRISRLEENREKVELESDRMKEHDWELIPAFGNRVEEKRCWFKGNWFRIQ
jgi:chaperonin cofactor prefoldin